MCTPSLIALLLSSNEADRDDRLIQASAQFWYCTRRRQCQMQALLPTRSEIIPNRARLPHRAPKQQKIGRRESSSQINQIIHPSCLLSPSAARCSPSSSTGSKKHSPTRAEPTRHDAGDLLARSTSIGYVSSSLHDCVASAATRHVQDGFWDLIAHRSFFVPFFCLLCCRLFVSLALFLAFQRDPRRPQTRRRFCFLDGTWINRSIGACFLFHSTARSDPEPQEGGAGGGRKDSRRLGGLAACRPQ